MPQIDATPLFLLATALLLLIPLFELVAIILFISLMKRNEPFKHLHKVNRKTYSLIPILLLLIAVALFGFGIFTAALSILHLDTLYLTAFSVLLFTHNKVTKTRIRCIFVILLSTLPSIALIVLMPLSHCCR